MHSPVLACSCSPLHTHPKPAPPSLPQTRTCSASAHPPWPLVQPGSWPSACWFSGPPWVRWGWGALTVPVSDCFALGVRQLLRSGVSLCPVCVCACECGLPTLDSKLSPSLAVSQGLWLSPSLHALLPTASVSQAEGENSTISVECRENGRHCSWAGSQNIRSLKQLSTQHCDQH